MNAALKIKKLEEQVRNLKFELAEAKQEDFMVVLKKAFNEHFVLSDGASWRLRVGSYPKATDADLMAFVAVMGQPKFGLGGMYNGGSFHALAMGVMHRLLDAETSHHLFTPDDSMCHGFGD